MPDDQSAFASKAESKGLALCDLKAGSADSIGVHVHDVIFRGQHYAIYRSEREIYVHFSDDETVGRKQRTAYS